MRQSKYVGKTFDFGWRCVSIGLANVQGKRAKVPGKRNYFYIFERETRDNKCKKILILNSTEAAAVWKGTTTVEYIAEKRQQCNETRVNKRINYHFCDKEI